MHIDAFLLIFGQLFILKSSRIASLCPPLLNNVKKLFYWYLMASLKSAMEQPSQIL